MWGNAPSVLVGDFLYSRSFEMMVELGSMLCEKLSGRKVEIGLVPFGSFGLTVFGQGGDPGRQPAAIQRRTNP